jgi:diguanylate cyclase (GGDEF)-like protein/PAS domain S-box-containing protein
MNNNIVISDIEWLKIAKESNYVGFMFVDSNGYILNSNKYCHKLFSYNDTSMKGMHINQFIPQRYLSTHELYYEKLLDTDGIEKEMKCDDIIYAKDSKGDEIPILCQLEQITNKEKNFFAITIIKASMIQKQLNERVYRDRLTKILNLEGFNHEAGRYLEVAKRYNHSFLISYIDLDDLKKINDNFGHEQGDCYIKFFTNTLSQRLRLQDIFARVGGDEFIYVAKEIELEQSKKLINDIKKYIGNVNFTIGNMQLPLAFSMGNLHISSYGKKNKKCSLQDLIRFSDNIMYEAKKNKLINPCHINLKTKKLN